MKKPKLSIDEWSLKEYLSWLIMEQELSGKKVKVDDSMPQITFIEDEIMPFITESYLVGKTIILVIDNYKLPQGTIKHTEFSFSMPTLQKSISIVDYIEKKRKER